MTLGDGESADYVSNVDEFRVTVAEAARESFLASLGLPFSGSSGSSRHIGGTGVHEKTRKASPQASERDGGDSGDRGARFLERPSASLSGAGKRFQQRIDDQ